MTDSISWVRLEDGKFASREFDVSDVLTRGLDGSPESKHEAMLAEINQIVEATFRVMERTDSVDPPIRDILTEAGLSTPAFYRHFKSKDELYVGILQRGALILESYLRHKMSAVDDPAEQVAIWMRGVLWQAIDPEAARRARSFILNYSRITAAYPDELAAIQAIEVALLRGPVSQLTGASPGSDECGFDVSVIYDLLTKILQRHLHAYTTPSQNEVDHVVRFVLGSLSTRS